MTKQQELFTEENDKRQGDGLDPLTVDEFVVELSLLECIWLERQVQ